MKIWYLVVIIVSICILMIAGCSSPKEYTSSAQPIEVKAGENFMITLGGNYTTGFTWTAEADMAYLKLVKDEYVVDGSKAGMVGVGGKQHYTFQALKTGSTEIKCTYERSFEKGKDAKYETFKVTIQ